MISTAITSRGRAIGQFGVVRREPEGIAVTRERLTTLYWHVGRRVRHDILKQNRAEYGGQIVSALRRQLEMAFGRGFSEKSLRHMIRFVEAFPDFQIVAALLRQMSWTHFVSIIYLDDPLKCVTGQRRVTEAEVQGARQYSPTRLEHLTEAVT